MVNALIGSLVTLLSAIALFVAIRWQRRDRQLDAERLAVRLRIRLWELDNLLFHLSIFFSDEMLELLRRQSGHDEEAWEEQRRAFRENAKYTAAALEWVNANEKRSQDLVVLKETLANVNSVLSHYRAVVKRLPQEVRDVLKTGG